MQIRLKGIGARLKEARERLGLSQHNFAQVGGVNRMTQGRYEAEVNFPGVDYLYLLSQGGIDASYILTGTAEADMTCIDSAEVLAKVMTWVDDLSAKHNYPLSPAKRVRVSLRLYREMVQSEREKVPSLADLLRIADE